VRSVILPEQREIEKREPAELPSARIPATPPPRTVREAGKTETWELSLDEAIRISLVNANVVRVLAGLSASSSGRTIYDVAITNTLIDVERARFDPVFTNRQQFERTETPLARTDPFDPLRISLDGTRIDGFRSETTLEQTNLLGGTASLRWLENPTRFANSPPGTQTLNPLNRNLFELSYTQPFLQGAGVAVNAAPIVIARIDTERSFFQYKDAVQEMVRGVVDGYWALVQARTEQWARQNQFDLAENDFQREEARRKVGLADTGTYSQKKVAMEQFRVSLVQAKATVLAREGALRNLLGLPPEDKRTLVPTTAPTTQSFDRDWDALVRLAERQRPDVVEFKLVLQADAQRLLQAENRTLPRLDGFTTYRWNGLSGETPNGQYLASGFGQFTDFTIGVNFSVPLGVREARARVRQAKLILERDQANLDQSLHQAIHQLAEISRDLDNTYEQYRINKELRAAALDNLNFQIAREKQGIVIYLNVLQALNDWGNAVSAEAQALTSYNTALANLERATGTILETHGLIFLEEQFSAAGPVGCWDALYPRAIRTAGTPTRYPSSGQASEEAFDLSKPTAKGRDGKPAPPEVVPPPVKGAPKELPLPKELPATLLGPMRR
jgi:outer membrane protein TolC